ncbi:MAG: hypothetical protein Q4E59_06025 [Bacteroidales bacterium]|nr:hypothetical protein [Bacteroidales bacterium]
MELTVEEAEFISLLRNYNKSYPNGYPQLLWELQEMFDDLLRQPE